MSENIDFALQGRDVDVDFVVDVAVFVSVFVVNEGLTRSRVMRSQNIGSENHVDFEAVHCANDLTKTMLVCPSSKPHRSRWIESGFGVGFGTFVVPAINDESLKLRRVQ
jgi:hypothetical protein